MESKPLTHPSREALLFYTALINEYVTDKVTALKVKEIFEQAQNTDKLINICNSDGNTLLHIAAIKGDYTFIIWLLDKKANLLVKNKQQ